MPEKRPVKQPEKRKKPKNKWVQRALSLLLSLFMMALVYCAAVLLQSPADTREGSFVVQDEQEPVTRMQAAAMNDAHALAQLFGAPLPMFPDIAVNGQSGNTTHDGQTVRIVTMQYDDLQITAVRPASAAPLLLRDGLSVSLRSDLTVLNLPAVLSSRGGAHCVYLSNESASYSLYIPNAGEDAFLSLLGRLSWAQ